MRADGVRVRLAGLLPDRGPTRVLVGCYLVDGVGTGLWMATSVLYFTRSVHLSTAQVGVGLSAAGLTGLAGAVPLGHLADRYGLRRVGLILMTVQGLLMASYALLRSFWPFVVVSCLFVLTQRGTNAVRNALLGASVSAERRLRTRAYTRSTANVGFAFGALLAAPVLHADSRAAYLTAVLANAGSFLLASALLTALPRVPGRRPAAGEARWAALRDRRYVAMTVLSGLLSLHKPVLTVALPLWVVLRTNAPRTLVSVLLVVSTVLTVLLQVPLSRGANGYAGGLRTVRRAGAALALACVLLGLAASQPPGVASALLVVGAVVLTVGEVWQSAGGWGLSYDLAPTERYGQYQGVYALGNGLRDTLGPTVVTVLALQVGRGGWLLLAAGFAGLGLVTAPVLSALGPGGRLGRSAQPAGMAPVEPPPESP
ncbi:MAG TPA: MFS transporter [Mycobacteriales bacterium]|nr:MFS transporter [Mycobacteriales bacterium]